MRTLDDLQGAFALLEREADEYAANHDEVLVSPADLITLSAAPSRRRRVRPALWLTAAAVAAAVTAGSLVLIDGLGGHAHAVGGPSRPNPNAAITAHQLQLPFSLDPRVGATVTHYRVVGSDTDADLLLHGHWLMLVLFGRGESGPKLKHPEQVQIDGARGQYVEQLTTQTVAAASAIPTRTSADVAASTPPSTLAPTPTTKWTRQLQWRAPDGHLALLQTAPGGEPATKADLLALARSLDLSSTTPIRVPFSLKSAPDELPLINVGVTLQPLQFDGFSYYGSWDADVVYRRGDRGGYSIKVSGRGAVGTHTAGAVPTKVRKHRAYWSAKDQTLTVEFGDGAYLDVTDFARSTDDASLTEQQAESVAAQVNVVAHTADQSRWFDAAKALPLGS